MFFKWPYLFGIFGMLFFYEVVNTILSYQMLGIAQDGASGISDVSAFLFSTRLMDAFDWFGNFTCWTSYLMTRVW